MERARVAADLGGGKAGRTSGQKVSARISLWEVAGKISLTGLQATGAERALCDGKGASVFRDQAEGPGAAKQELCS